SSRLYDTKTWPATTHSVALPGRAVDPGADPQTWRLDWPSVSTRRSGSASSTSPSRGRGCRPRSAVTSPESSPGPADAALGSRTSCRGATGDGRGDATWRGPMTEKTDEAGGVALFQSTVAASLVMAGWEHHRAELEGFADPAARSSQVRDAVIDVVGWDAVHDAIATASHEFADWETALEVALGESGYSGVQDELS